MKSVKTTLQQVNITPKMSVNHSKKRVIFPKVVKITPEEWISLFWRTHRGTTSLSELSKKVKFTLFEEGWGKSFQLGGQVPPHVPLILPLALSPFQKGKGNQLVCCWGPLSPIPFTERLSLLRWPAGLLLRPFWSCFLISGNTDC